MDSSLYGLQGRVLSFEEARNWFLEHNANRVAPSLMYNSDERRRNSQTTLNTIHNSVISVPYQTLPTRQRSLSREGSTNRPKTLAGKVNELYLLLSGGKKRKASIRGVCQKRVVSQLIKFDESKSNLTIIFNAHPTFQQFLQNSYILDSRKHFSAYLIK